MNTKLSRSIALCAGLLTLLVSCGSPKRYAYLQDVELTKQYSATYDNQIIVRSGDRLNISVSSSYPELARPFTPLGFDSSVPGLSQLGVANIPGATSGTSAEETRGYGYLVSSSGEINFPVLGKLKIAGLTKEQVTQLIEQRILEGKYIPDPRVAVEYANFRIFLLGAALGGNPGDGGRSGSSNYYQQGQSSSFGRIPGVNGGVLQVYDKDRLNILEAISLINDMPMNANIEKVNVIRLIKGQYVTFRMNLKSVDIFQSPGFYLQQNDILYVEHRYRRDEFEGIQRVMQVSGYIFSSIASVVAIVALIKK